MKLCGKCRRKPWPFAIVMFLSTFVAFVTWLTLAAAGFTPEMNRWLTAAAFLVAGGILSSYMLACMRRHCSHDRHVR